MSNPPITRDTNFFKLGAFDFMAEIRHQQAQILRLMDQATEHLATTDTPTYTGVDQSRILLEMSLPYYESGKCMPTEYLSTRTNPLFSNPLNLAAVDKMFEALLTFHRMPPIFLVPAYQYFLGATLLLPDILVPSFEINRVDSDSSLPYGTMDSKGFRVILNIRDTLLDAARLPSTIRHEMLHLAQQIRGIQLGLSDDILQFSQPAIIASILVAFPSLREADPMYTGLLDYYESGAFHRLLRFAKTANELSILARFGIEKLRAIAETRNLKISDDPYKAANELYPLLSDYLVPLSPEIERLLTPDERAFLLEIKENEKTLYLQKPMEAEAFALERFGLILGNPYLLVEAGKERGILQMPLEEGARIAFFDQLTEASVVRKAKYLQTPDPLGLNSLLGRSQEKPPAQMDFSRWFDPKDHASPSVDDVRRLSEEVKRRAVVIRDTTERMGRTSVERFTVK